jgi:hypothetical protein
MIIEMGLSNEVPQFDVYDRPQTGVFRYLGDVLTRYLGDVLTILLYSSRL